jgi:hypothetical protein
MFRLPFSSTSVLLSPDDVLLLARVRLNYRFYGGQHIDSCHQGNSSLERQAIDGYP